jgi:hypothetical protein
MARFNRRFEVEHLEELVERTEHWWFLDLLRYWYPSGDRAGQTMPAVAADSDTERLRVAVRNGYLNFYQNGQSIAKVSSQDGRLLGSIHPKYVYGARVSTLEYVTLERGLYAVPGEPQREYGKGLLDEWMQNAVRYAKPEKRFVDALIGRNSNIIDLEVGLPATGTIALKAAPRMDLVTLQLTDDAIRIDFWEAKLVDNARRDAEEKPTAPSLNKSGVTNSGYVRVVMPMRSHARTTGVR